MLKDNRELDFFVIIYYLLFIGTQASKAQSPI